jgi:hypothetical protein
MRDLVTTGPFLSASVAIEKLSHGLYFSSLLMETIEKQKECEFELQMAKITGDLDLVKQCEADLAIIERAYTITSMLDFDDSVQ